jgi:hypothetical protein
MSVLKDLEFGPNDQVFDELIVTVKMVNSTMKYPNKNNDGVNRIQNLTVKDDNGDEVNLVLWHAQTDCEELSTVGNRLLLREGTYRTYNGNKQISAGYKALITRIAPKEEVVEKKKSKKAKK